MTELVFYSEARIALTREIKNHPLLLAQIEESKLVEWPDILGVMAAHFNVEMDGYYSSLDLAVLEDKLWKKLVAKRNHILTPTIGKEL